MFSTNSTFGDGMHDAPFTALKRVEGYLPIGDHGLIGDGATAALVGRDGGISWLCVPRFDSPPLFCGLLDARGGGAFTLAPDEPFEARQYYKEDTAVLVTEMRTASGLLRITDALALTSSADLSEDAMSARGELVRCAKVQQGQMRVRVFVKPCGGGDARARGDGLNIRCKEHPDLDLQLSANVELRGLENLFELREGDSVDLMLRWSGGHYHYHPLSPSALIQNTADAWRQWSRQFSYDGPQKWLVGRSAITLKLLDHFENGAIIAAPTSSLPECIGGSLNWDYRYVWIRDAAFSVYALRRIGLPREADAFLGWVLDQLERRDEPKLMYTLYGGDLPREYEDKSLEGYRRSQPVRWGNDADGQRQDDIYGEIVDCAYQWASPKKWSKNCGIDAPLWQRLCELAEAAAENWGRKDHGIWELRGGGRRYTYSAGLCHVALDRMVKLAQATGLPGDVARWRKTAGQIQQAILQDAWSDEKQSLVMCLDGGGLDASLLTLPIRRVVPPDHPRMVATVKAIMDGLGAGDGLLYRFAEKNDSGGSPCEEGAFLLCSFWLVDNLTEQGRLDEAAELYDSLCDRAGPLGLLPEQIDPATGDFLGNYPQAFSHVGVIASGLRLSRAQARKRGNS